ncbi:MAG: polysaccharide deacetylase family protein [Gemmatimonadaceae bacterium]
MLSSLALVGAAAVVSHGAFHRNSPVFGPTLARLPASDRNIALTFDDGPNPVATPLVLDVLARERVSATFFMLGRHVERWPDLARRVATEAHQLGNHGYHHRALHLRGPAYVRLDLGLGTEAIERATGSRPAFFRAPHGFRNPWVNGIARGLGQRTVGWTLGVWDSYRPGAEEIASRAIAGAGAGCILLLHDGDGYDPHGDRTQTAAALPRIIGALRERGFRFVTLPS